MNMLFVLDSCFEWQGIRCLSAALKHAGYGCELIIESNIEKIADYVHKHRPDICGFLTLTGQHKFCIACATAIKQITPETKIIFGGPHATFFPDVIQLDPVDYICQGEGDEVLVELFRRIENCETTVNIPGISAKHNGRIYKNPPQKFIENLDNLPLPDDEIFEKYSIFRKSNERTVMAGRGCPYQCSFCFNKHMKKIYQNKSKYVRFRSPEKIIDEIMTSRSKYSFKYVRFQDDVFTINKKWFLDFAEKYQKQVRLPYYANVRVNCVDEEIVRVLKESGCYLACFGLESGVERIRNEILKKNIDDKEIIQTAKLFHKYRIPFATTNMLALPTETFEEGCQTIRFNQKIGTKVPWYSVFMPYPSTEIADYVKRIHRISFCQDGFDYDYHSKSVLNTKDADKLAKLHKFAILSTKFPKLLPIVKLIVNLPDNFLFKIIHRISHSWVYFQCNKNGYLNTVLIGLYYELSKLRHLLLSRSEKRVKQSEK